MKNFRFSLLAFLTILTSLLFTACSDDDNSNNGYGEEKTDVHYDVWVSVGEPYGMGSDATLLVRNMESLEEQTAINFKNVGCDVTATLKAESIIKGKYYYQVPVSGDRFGKYQITDNGIKIIAERPFGTNVYKPRSYTHAWLGDETLVILAASGDRSKVFWTKLNANSMTIAGEGTLGLIGKDNDVTQFTTSGLAKYRKSDNKIIYAFKQYAGRTGVVPSYFYVAFINATTMEVEKVVKEERADQMAGTAYGELLQNMMFFDENENLYIACNSQIAGTNKATCQYGRILRIKKGETDFDKSYEGYKYDSGKLKTIDYLGNNKVLLYIQDPEYTGNGSNTNSDNWGDKKYNAYYALLDLATDKKEEFTYNGEKLPYSIGTFTQRSFILNNKVYIGVNPERSAPAIYIYDSRTSKVTLGSTIADGYEFCRIVYIANE